MPFISVFLYKGDRKSSSLSSSGDAKNIMARTDYFIFELNINKKHKLLEYKMYEQCMVHNQIRFVMQLITDIQLTKLGKSA